MQIEIFFTVFKSLQIMNNIAHVHSAWFKYWLTLLYSTQTGKLTTVLLLWNQHKILTIRVGQYVNQDERTCAMLFIICGDLKTVKKFNLHFQSSLRNKISYFEISRSSFTVVILVWLWKNRGIQLWRNVPLPPTNWLF